ncbi:PLP-dependent aminotransferase family protein [Peribacillus sp. NPDC006672]|uniref:aminotransferase-like domain-containing protein n=1 Tax=Peribacillus sp. NPDC006672 TaxID=3390606 RepID=UPI003D020776
MRKTPLYLQIVDLIRGKILRGEWPVGSKLPTQREMAKQFNVNRSTVITAIEILKSENLLEGKTGSGVYIVNNQWSLLTANSPHNWNDLSEWALYPPSDNIVQKINEMENRKDIIHLSKGELGIDLFPHSEIAQAAEKVSGQLHEFGYGVGLGDINLRIEISKHLLKHGIHASPTSILIVSGALQALKLISVGTLKRGSTVFIENPSYLYSIYLFRAAGMTLKPISINENGLNIEELFQQKIKKSLSALYVNPTFQNPTTTIMSSQNRQLLIEKCQYSQLPIIEDDIYRDLWIDEPAPAPLKTFDKQGQVLYIGSFSKTIAAGLRIGWLVGPEDVIHRLSDLRMQNDYGSSYVSQMLVKELLSSGLYEQHLNRTRTGLKQKRAFLLHLLNQHFRDYATWSIPTGGFFIWVTFHKKINTRILFKQCLSNGVLINPGFIYNDNKPTIRFSFAYPSFDEMEKGISKIKELLITHV